MCNRRYKLSGGVQKDGLEFQTQKKCQQECTPQSECEAWSWEYNNQAMRCFHIFNNDALEFVHDTTSNFDRMSISGLRDCVGKLYFFYFKNISSGLLSFLFLDTKDLLS